ncbi:unnamed protein product [Paramecium pentaurelia]|uniref:Uncharacterized protein n=1 Tax=Paramecium pentaurelia TaxID=43138 RepID=A0A8S1X891_9CILI|nr:unnamed protein product [Paramecium pentaurelia]
MSQEQLIIIPTNLYCFQQDLKFSLNEMQSAYQIYQFKQQHILLQDLKFGISFKELENRDFYLSANSMLIKTIQVSNSKYIEFMEMIQQFDVHSKLVNFLFLGFI